MVQDMQTVAAARRRILLLAAASLPLVAAVWLAVHRLVPPIATDRTGFALGAGGAAMFLALLPVIQAVAHERLFSPAIDPLAGRDSTRLIVNQRVLQNTVEQTLIFLPGLALVARYAADLRTAAACAIIWVLGRWAFWAGYHHGSLWRGLGAFTLVQALLMLAYGVGAFGYALAGWIGATALVGPFIVMEALLLIGVRRPAR